MPELEAVFAPFRSVLGNYNIWITTSQPVYQAEIIPASSLLDQTILLEFIQARARSLGTNDLRAAASDWQLYYNRAVLPLVLVGMTLGGIGLDTDIANVSLILEADKPHSALLVSLETSVFYPPRSNVVQKEWREVKTLEELHQFVFTQLFQKHFSPIFEALHATTHLSRKILWGNLANSCFSLYAFLSEVLNNPTVCVEDSTALLARPYNFYVADGKNPLYQPVHNLRLNVPDLPEVVQVRRTCCLYYRLPGYTKCTNCPLLKLPERLTRWKTLLADQNNFAS